MCYDSHKVRCLPERRVDLLPLDIIQLLDPPEPKPTYRTILVHRRDVEDLIDEVGFPELLVHECQVLGLAIDLLLQFQLGRELLLIVIHFRPDAVLLGEDVLLFLLELFELGLLFLLLEFDVFDLVVEGLFLDLEFLELFQEVFVLLALVGLVDLSFNLQELFLVVVSFNFLAFDFAVERLEDLVETLKAYGVFELNLDVLEIGEVFDSEIKHDAVADV